MGPVRIERRYGVKNRSNVSAQTTKRNTIILTSETIPSSKWEKRMQLDIYWKRFRDIPNRLP
jgi:hypothetical protein